MSRQFAPMVSPAIAAWAIAMTISLPPRWSPLDWPERSVAAHPLPPVSRAAESHRSVQLVDRVIEGSDFDTFRDRLWRAIQQRDQAFMAAIIPADGLFIGQMGPIPASQLALDDPESPFWHSLEKMIAPHSCELEDYPGSEPDAAVWGCPNIASALRPAAPEAASRGTPEETPPQVVVVGQQVNVRSQPRLGTAVVGRLSNQAVEFDQQSWQELRQRTPEVSEDPIDGWTPVILPNRVQGYVYNRYVYHPQGPRALFEQIAGHWQLRRIVFDAEDPELNTAPLP